MKDGRKDEKDFLFHTGEYMFQLGLFGKKSNHTETDLPGVARDEQQEIQVLSNANPSVQVSLIL